jgi:glycosyltransferase involved in cell wall biosynthesis
MDEKFRFLWLSAPNMRKGVDEAIKAFVGEFKSKGLNAELYIKSTLFEAEGKLLDWSKEFSAVVDTRMISKEELRELYWSADCLVYPSKGEGAGMIPMEFMSCGGVVLAPPYSGMKDYMFKEFSMPLQFTMQDAHYGCQTRVAHVNMEDLRKKMAWIFYNRTLINVYGLRASAFVKERFSLSVMAKNFKSYLEEVCHD